MSDMPEIRVVNRNREPFDVYIGRGSIWGNPFRLARDHTDADRARVVQQYEQYLLARPELMARLPELRGKRLGCFCAPSACHGDVLKKHAEQEAPTMTNHMTNRYSHALLITGARTWSSEDAMRGAFNEAWRIWEVQAAVVWPLLISGHCPQGADAMAERLWRAAGFDVLEVPADWDAYPRRAGFERNQHMIDLAVSLRTQGSEVLCAAFLDLCRKPRCPWRGAEQLMPSVAGHFSHGTAHCRSRALEAAIGTIDILPAALRPSD